MRTEQFPDRDEKRFGRPEAKLPIAGIVESHFDKSAVARKRPAAGRLNDVATRHEDTRSSYMDAVSVVTVVVRAVCVCV
jgi:hypothetical protein